MELTAWQLGIQEKEVMCQHQGSLSADSEAWDIGQIRVRTPVPQETSSRKTEVLGQGTGVGAHVVQGQQQCPASTVQVGFGIESTAHSLRRGLNIHITEIIRVHAEWQEIGVELLKSLR